MRIADNQTMRRRIGNDRDGALLRLYQFARDRILVLS
jgi:hypothetical protein